MPWAGVEPAFYLTWPLSFNLESLLLTSEGRLDHLFATKWPVLLLLRPTVGGEALTTKCQSSKRLPIPPPKHIYLKDHKSIFF